ncbi:hypothetical protein [Paenibacillus xylanexedens]|uniref:hypothetical protein n=1 Tax=Paenibacillus xylanexedens TaxID=528191 RepID=UPI00119F5A26|nr:hypothetical protein [Paenibacillus xylanexedens]
MQKHGEQGWRGTADVRGRQGLGALLALDFFHSPLRRWKSDGKLALAAPSFPLTAGAPLHCLLAMFSLADTHRASSL